MISLSKNISFTDDPFVSWDFVIPNLDKLIAEKKDDLNDLMNNFYRDYIIISQKHQIGEIIPRSFLGDIDLEKLYCELCDEFVLLNERISFFPLSDIKNATTNDIFTRLHPGSTFYHLFDGEKFHPGYFNIVRGKARPILHENYRNLYWSDENFEIIGIGEYHPGQNKSNDFELGFTLSIYSEFWFEKTCFKNAESWENGKQNIFNAYYNAPRLNSYLRDLKTLWEQKYSWKCNFCKGWYGTTENGVLLNGEIIYQEDIDEGKVIIPGVDELV